MEFTQMRSFSPLETPPPALDTMLETLLSECWARSRAELYAAACETPSGKPEAGIYWFKITNEGATVDEAFVSGDSILSVLPHLPPDVISQVNAQEPTIDRIIYLEVHIANRVAVGIYHVREGVF
jgi:hypothetical protein